MSSSTVSSTLADMPPENTKLKHPTGLYVLFATEMWERFSFYTMLAMLTLYLQDTKDGFGWSREWATGLYANYLMFVYASPLIGGWLADKKLGFRVSITLGGLFMMAGHILLAFPQPSRIYSALTCLVIGNGFFKPNVSAMVGKPLPVGEPAPRLGVQHLLHGYQCRGVHRSAGRGGGEAEVRLPSGVRRRWRRDGAFDPDLLDFRPADRRKAASLRDARAAATPIPPVLRCRKTCHRSAKRRHWSSFRNGNASPPFA